LLLIAQASGALGPQLGRRQYWQKQRCQDTDDCDHNQQFNQCEGANGRPSTLFGGQAFTLAHKSYLLEQTNHRTTCAPRRPAVAAADSSKAFLAESLVSPATALNAPLPGTYFDGHITKLAQVSPVVL
jgi:hypothetical protein